MSFSLTTLVQHALASDPFAKVATMIDAVLAVLLLVTLGEREVLRSVFPGRHSQIRVLAAVIPPLLLVGVLFMSLRLAGLLG